MVLALPVTHKNMWAISFIDKDQLSLAAGDVFACRLFRSIILCDHQRFVDCQERPLPPDNLRPIGPDTQPAGCLANRLKRIEDATQQLLTKYTP
jgi:hypothetical protein